MAEWPKSLVLNEDGGEVVRQEGPGPFQQVEVIPAELGRDFADAVRIGLAADEIPGYVEISGAARPLLERVLSRYEREVGE